MAAIRQFWHSKFVRDTLILQVGKVGVTGLSVLSSILVFRFLGADDYGVWALVQSFLAIWQSLDLTGVSASTSTRLSMAVGARDETDILNQMAFYVQMSALWSVSLTALILLLGAPLARGLYGDERIGLLAAWLSLTVLPDALYNLLLLSLQSRRLMRPLALLQNANQFVLVGCVVAAIMVSPTPESMIVARLVYSVSTLLLAGWVYRRLRSQNIVFPPLTQVFARARTLSPRQYWRFGVLNALDKNLSNLYTALPLQIVGILSGEAAAGFLELGFRGMTIPNLLTSAVFDNLQAVIPQAVGRGDFVRLWANLRRVLGVLTLAALGFYTTFALIVPLLVPLLYGEAALPAVPVIAILSIYGAVTMIGGTFGPIYRALSLLRAALWVKLFTLAVVLAPGILLIQSSGAVGGAWLVNLLFFLSVLLTAGTTLPVLRRKSRLNG